MNKNRCSTFLLVLIIGVIVTLPTYAEERPLYQWTDRKGVDNWSDKNPLTDPSRQPKREVLPLGDRIMPKLDAQKISRHLREQGGESIPELCLARNQSNSAQRSICEQFQMRALTRIDDFVTDPDNIHASFIYQRCSSKWMKKNKTDFVSFAQCVGIEL